MSLTAAHCAKTLILASTSANAMLLGCTRLLIPSLIEYVAKIAPLVFDGSISEPQVAAVGEVWKAFSAFFASIAENHRKLRNATAKVSRSLYKRCPAIEGGPSHNCSVIV
jgi:HEAT repeat-containing protein 5